MNLVHRTRADFRNIAGGKSQQFASATNRGPYASDISSQSTLIRTKTAGAATYSPTMHHVCATVLIPVPILATENTQHLHNYISANVPAQQCTISRRAHGSEVFLQQFQPRMIASPSTAATIHRCDKQLHPAGTSDLRTVEMHERQQAAGSPLIDYLSKESLRGVSRVRMGTPSQCHPTCAKLHVELRCTLWFAICCLSFMCCRFCFVLDYETPS